MSEGNDFIGRPEALSILIDDWAEDAESELRIHAGVPLEGRAQAGGIVHNTLLAFFDEIIQRPDFEDMVKRRRAELEVIRSGEGHEA